MMLHSTKVEKSIKHVKKKEREKNGLREYLVKEARDQNPRSRKVKAGGCLGYEEND